MGEIGSWSGIVNKRGVGKRCNEWGRKGELLGVNNGKEWNVEKVIVISNGGRYGKNECVKLEDMNGEEWIYRLEWDGNGNGCFNGGGSGGR